MFNATNEKANQLFKKMGVLKAMEGTSCVYLSLQENMDMTVQIS